MLTRRRLLESSAALAVAANSTPALVRAQTAEKVILQIDGAAVPYYAPIYMAVQKGYLKDRGLDVEIIYAAASDILVNIAADNVTLGFPNGDAVIAGKASGLPIKVVHTTYQRGIGALLALESAGIKTYADLKGKKVAVTSLGSPNYLQLQVGLQKVGLKLDDVAVEVIATGAIVQALQAKAIDAIIFSELRKYNLEAAGAKVTMISSNSFLPSFGNVLVTSDATLARKPGVIKKFIEALDEGLKYVIEGHADESIRTSIAKYAPTFTGQEDLIASAFASSFIPSIWQSPMTKEKGFGAADLKAWQTNIDILAEYKVIANGFRAADLVVQPGDIKA